MISQLFKAHKSKAGNFLGKDEYETFLGKVDAWNTSPYTPGEWDKQWPEECRLLQSTPDKGIGRLAFEHLYTKGSKHAVAEGGVEGLQPVPCRAAHLRSDFRKLEEEEEGKEDEGEASNPQNVPRYPPAACHFV